MTDAGQKEYHVDVDSDILDVDPPQDSRLTEALASAGAVLIRMEPPRFTVKVSASSESEAEERAVEALERWVSGPGAGWRVVAVTRWLDG